MLARKLISSSTFDSASLAYFAVMSPQPTASAKTKIDTLIRGLKVDGLWTKIDWLLLLASNDTLNPRVNLKSPAKLCNSVGSVVFTANGGAAGDGVSAYLDLQEAFNAAGNVYAQNSAHLMTYLNSGAGNANFDVGTTSSGSVRLGAEAAAGAELVRVHQASSNTYTSTGPLGCRVAVRTGSTAGELYRDGVAKLGGVLVASAAVPAGNGRLLASDTTFSARRMAAFSSGGGLNSTEAGNLRSRIVTYLTAIGAN